MPKEGDRLGRFEIERKLGEGGMGIVYLARDTLLDIQVAIKLLSPAIVLRDDDLQDRFKREVLVARQVAHPAVCRLFDIHQEDEFIFLSMEYVAGRTLKSMLQEQRVLPPAEAVGIMLNVLEGVAAAHELDIVHRDLKPGNIIVKDDGRVSILDFGLSKALKMASITRTGVQVGTVNYMSPEVLRGKVASPQSDIYSLGVILYECLCGRLPFRGDSMEHVGRAIESASIVPPSAINPTVAPAIEEVTLKAMARDPARRYASADLFASALKAGRKNAPPPLPRKSAPPEKTRPAAAAAGSDVRPPPGQPVQPWDRDIDKSVQLVIGDPDSSSIIKARMRDTTILFSDIVGITTYFDSHGDVAGMRKINKHNELLFPVIERYDGKVIKTIGDAIMACFESADNGVGAAIGMQRALAEYNSEFTASEDKILVRIGLNSGQSIFQDSDIFGDSVNVAARISAKAGANQILVSEATQKSLNPDLHATNYYSQVELKGKEEPVKLYTVEWIERSEQPTSIISIDALSEPVPLPVAQKTTVIEPRRLLPRRRKRMLYVGGGGLVIAAAIIGLALFQDRPKNAADVGPASIKAGDRVVDAGLQTPDAGDPGALSAANPPPAEDADAGSGKDADLDGETQTPDAGHTVEPATRPPAGETVARRRLYGLTKKIARLARRKGIIAGDNSRLDEARERIHDQKAAGDYSKALKTARRAYAILKRARVNRKLVSDKLLRFNKLFDQADAATRRRLDRYSGKIGQAIVSKKYSKANQLLNDAMRMLK